MNTTAKPDDPSSSLPLFLSPSLLLSESSSVLKAESKQRSYDRRNTLSNDIVYVHKQITNPISSSLSLLEYLHLMILRPPAHELLVSCRGIPIRHR